ncbi:hypothetical protein [Haloarchaeobius sp. TZWWS8]|uniref:hypothetical protein n=1 Tax=Haloarchaeobius sp. TZWWS8 TaxID=3446121 RepID=UPI003EC1460E
MTLAEHTEGAQLSVDADLRLSVGSETVSMYGYGRTVVVEVPSIRAARAFRRASRQPPVERLFDALKASGGSLDLRVNGVSVAGFDHRSKSGPLSRVLGFRPATVYPEGILMAVLRRIPPR